MKTRFLKSLAKTDPNEMILEAIRHWFDNTEFKYRDCLEAVFLDKDREIMQRTYDGDYLPSTQGLKICVFHSHDLPVKNKQFKTVIEPFGYSEVRDFGNFLYKLFDIDKIEIEVYDYSDFIGTNKNRDYRCPDCTFVSGYLIRLRDEPVS